LCGGTAKRKKLITKQPLYFTKSKIAAARRLELPAHDVICCL